MPQDATWDYAVVGGGGALLVAGFLLCFAGVRVLRLAAACAGFGLGVVVAAVLGAGVPLALVCGALAGVLALVLAGVLVRGGFFLLGVLGGGLVAASWFRTFSMVGTSPAIVLIVVLAAALVGGIGAARAGSAVLVVVTALAGSGLLLRGAVAVGPAFLGFLHDPTTLVGAVVAAAVWLALAVAGVVVQRRGPARRAAAGGRR